MYTLLQRRNTTNDDQIKEFEAYIKVIELYRGKNPDTLARLKPISPRWKYWIPIIKHHKKRISHKNNSRLNT